MSAIGRKSAVVNLDPANEQVTYPCAVDVRDFITLDDVMDEFNLGPNGGVVCALEEVLKNFDWLAGQLRQLGDDYVLFDLPGQVELFTHNSALSTICKHLEKKCGYRLVVVHLVDSHYCTEPAKYVSVLLLALRSMLMFELPYINVLSKIDILRDYGKLDFNLDFYTEVQDLDYLLPALQGSQMSKYAGLNKAIIDLVTDFGLVGFETCAVEDKKSMTRLLQVVDHAVGYTFGPAEGAGDTVWQMAVRGGWANEQSVYDIQERWIDRKDEYDAMEKAQESERQQESPEIEK